MTHRAKWVRSFLIFLIVLLPNPISAQLTFSSVLVNEDNEDYYANQGVVELNYDEEFRLEIRAINSSHPEEPLPFNCLVDKIEVTATNGSDVIKLPQDALDRDPNIRRWPKTAKNILKNSGWDVTSFNVQKIELSIRVVYRVKDKVSEPNCSGLAKNLPSEVQVDYFTVRVKHYGTYVLFDLTPVATSSGAILDFLGGVLNSLAYSSVDYPIIFGEGRFSSSLMSAPIIDIETRKWFKHFDIQAIVAKDLSQEKMIGKGIALGMWKPIEGYSLFKFGLYYLNDDPHANWLIGFSLPGLTKWISAK